MKNNTVLFYTLFKKYGVIKSFKKKTNTTTYI